MKLLGASGSALNPDKIIKGNLIFKNNNLLFKSKELTLIYNHNYNQVFYNQLREYAKNINQYIYLYVDNKSYDKYIPEFDISL